VFIAVFICREHDLFDAVAIKARLVCLSVLVCFWYIQCAGIFNAGYINNEI